MFSNSLEVCRKTNQRIGFCVEKNSCWLLKVFLNGQFSFSFHLAPDDRGLSKALTALCLADRLQEGEKIVLSQGGDDETFLSRKVGDIYILGNIGYISLSISEVKLIREVVCSKLRALTRQTNIFSGD